MMVENLKTAFVLLIVGIIMVMIVLWLLVGLGNLLIKLTNKHLPEEKTEGISKIENRRVAAITAAVDIITQGQGRVDSIQKK